MQYNIYTLCYFNHIIRHTHIEQIKTKKHMYDMVNTPESCPIGHAIHKNKTNVTNTRIITGIQNKQINN
jgi:hypothetical protein